MFVTPGLWSPGGGKRKLFSDLCRIPRARVHDRVGCLFRRKGVQRLMIFLRKSEVQSNALEVDLHAIAGIISKNNMYGNDSRRKWGLFRELLLIECGVGPWPGRDGHAL